LASGFAARTDTEAAAQQVGDQQLECSGKDERKVAAGFGMAQEVARGFELALERCVDRELELVALSGDRFDSMPGRSGT
jgi:hypothetical protein